MRFGLAIMLVGCATPPRDLVIRAGRLVDGSGGPAQMHQRVSVHDGVITAVSPDDDSSPSDAIDARDATVMPGLINAHAHLMASGACEPRVGGGVGTATRNLSALLAAGVTTVADLGAPLPAAIGLRRYAGTARHRGPRVLVAGPLLTAPGGYLTGVLDGDLVKLGLVREVASPNLGRELVRDLADAGVDLIKVALQETNFDLQPLPLLEGETLCAVIDEAHRQKLRVVAHATSNRAYTAALDCKVDALMHAPIEPLAPEVLARVVAAHLPVTPTLFVFAAPLWGPEHMDFYRAPSVATTLGSEALESLEAYTAANARGGEFLPPMVMVNVPRAGAVLAARALRDNGRIMAHAGVALALGTDGGNCMNPLGSPIRELELLADTGLGAAGALAAATSGSAKILDLQDALGKLAVGYRADLIVVEGAPDVHLDDITRVRQVIVDGVVQAPARPWYATPLALFYVGWTWLGG